jgi:hypothetical protein
LISKASIISTISDYTAATKIEEFLDKDVYSDPVFKLN